LVPFSPITGIMMKWLHSLATATPAPEPTLTPLENDVWTADSILQMMRSKRDTNEDSLPRDKRFIFLGWLAFDQLKTELQQIIPRKNLDSRPKRDVGDTEREKRFLSAWMILDFIRASFGTTPEPLPEPVTLVDTDNSTSTREKRSIDDWVSNMMGWLGLPLMGNQTLLTQTTPPAPTTAPTTESYLPTVQRYYDYEEDYSEDDTDYSYDTYLLVLVFGISVIAVISTLAMYVHGDYVESLKRQEADRYALGLMEMALAVWTIEAEMDEACAQELPPPYDNIAPENAERF
jgi:hypothetical protein